MGGPWRHAALAIGALITSGCEPPAPTGYSHDLPSLHPDTTLGCQACPGDELFGEVLALAVNDSGTMLVGDNSAPHLRRFGPAHGGPRAAGVPGRGPGEVEIPSHIVLRPDGSFEILDLRLSRRTWYDSEGQVQATGPLPGIPVAVAPTGGDLLMAITTMGSRTPVFYRWSAGEMAPVPIPDLLSRLVPVGETPIGELSLAISPAGQVAVATGLPAYRIAIVDGEGTLIRTVSRLLERVPKTAAEIEHEQRMVLDRMAQVAGRAGVSPRVTGPIATDPLRPHFRGGALQFDRHGRLWVLTERWNATQSLYDLFDPTGAFLGELAVPKQVVRFAIGGDFLVDTYRDPDGTFRVRRWRIMAGGMEIR